MNEMMTEEQAMKYALKLALRGRGKVSPNPLVGAVILENGKVAGEGWHEEFGGPHAEVNAIRNAGKDDFSGCTIVLNLEPCAHEGKTPPCTDLIIENKFSRVVAGMQDPNTQVAGKGFEKLRDAGIDVEYGLLEEECKWLNRFFIKHITTGMPYIISKAAQSLDGVVALSNGESKWISSEESRRRVHVLRSHVDAVLVGRQTAETDNPRLTVRHVKGRNPRRIFLDTNLSLPLGLDAFRDSTRYKTIVCCSEAAATSRKAENLKIAGVSVIPMALDSNGRIGLSKALRRLSDDMNISSIMVEGGAGIFSSLAREDLIDELQLFIAPKIFGSGKSAYSQFTIDSIEEALDMKIKGLSVSGGDIHIIALS